MNAYPNKCYLCNNNSFELVTNDLRYEYNGGIYRCQKCDLTFLNPGMDQEQERIFYEQEYGDIYSYEKGTTPQLLYQARLLDAEMYYNWIKEWLGPDKNCLEIGCASGYFLKTIQSRVNHITGVESHHVLRSFCSEIGIDMFDSVSNCPSGSYDLVFLFFVLEHIGDPIPFLEEIGRVLKPAGQLICVVPNVDDALIKLYNIPEIIHFYYTPAHQFYYSKETMTLLFDKSKIWGDLSIIPKQRYDVSNHMNWMQYGKPGGQGKYNAYFSEKLNQEYAMCLEKHFLCDTLLLHAKRM